jgi:dephospho-CoA kinase
MLRIGVTGLIASGKSTVARRFEERGATRVDADALGWGVLRRPEIEEALALAFGEGIRAPDGSVDRARLGRIVFRDEAALAGLNAIVQPGLLAEVRAALRTAAGPVVVLDAALLTTWKLERELDGVVEVTAPAEMRLARLRAARGYGEEEARARILGQRLPPVAGARRHWMIENSADVASLLVRADAVWTEIEALAGRPAP